MITIGITGGVGSGKSSVLDYIKRHYSAYVILADEVGHQLMEPGGATYDRLIEVYGNGILIEDGTIDKKKLAEIALKDASSIQKIKGLTNPFICNAIGKAMVNNEKN